MALFDGELSSPSISSNPRKFTMAKNEKEEIVQLPEDKVLFIDFMQRVAEFNQLVEAGTKFIQGFNQELEYLKRPGINMESKLISKIIKSNMTNRMKSYLDAGCTRQNRNIQSLKQLNSCYLGLQDYIKKAKTLVDKMEYLSDNAYKIAMESNKNEKLNLLQNNFDQSTNREDEENEQGIHAKEKSDVQIAIMMYSIYNMFKLDYTMQEKVVTSVETLNLNIPLSDLESYNLMWQLRPYVSDDILRHAWKIYKLIL